MNRITVSMLFGVALVLALAVPAVAADDAVVPDEQFVHCTVCHGTNIGGNEVLQAPRLSSLPAWYVERQLHAFSKGWRGTHDEDAGGQEMRPMAAALSEKQITAASRYVDAVESLPPATTVAGDAGRGKTLYTSCAACHGADGRGNELMASPPLTGLNDWYMLTQLRNFRAGYRGSNPDDAYGQQMKAAAAVLQDEQAMQDVVSYISTIGNTKRNSQ